MLRLHYPESLVEQSEVVLDKAASHHLLKVMRAKKGDEFVVFNTHHEFLAEVSGVHEGLARVRIKSQRVCNTESPIHITLLQAVTRRERMNYSIQKATELGVNCIQPVMTKHCIVKLDNKKSLKRISHWEGIAQHATEQSGRLQIPVIKPVLNWDQAINEKHISDSDLKLIFALESNSPLNALKGIASKPDNICIALGPVGGFSSDEVSLALENGFQSIKLGPRILRAETATTAALTAVQLLWGDLNNDQ